ncbi:AI-2E family transporter [Clostridium sp. HBUAS56017]|uniref:AI-2E family transporter n=1 Tax=Clostridium sp. HBUAS56017 TaxID=2571128 RepID=UPI0011775A4E|nr:AI-2E family transporter [Clostridium sp. HBUAS56017]
MNYFKDQKFKSNLILATCIIIVAYIFMNLNTVGNLLNVGIGIIKPFLIGMGVAFVLNLPMKFFEDNVIGKILEKAKIKNMDGIKRPLAIIITLFVIIGTTVGIILFVIPQLIESGSTLVKNIPSYVKSLQDFVSTYMGSMGSTEIFNEVSEKISSMGANILNIIGQVTGGLISQILSITVGVTSAIFNVFMGILIAIYILISKEKLSMQTKKLLYAFMEKDKVSKILKVAEISNYKFSKFVIGQCVEAVILGGLCFIGMIIFKMPYAILVSTIIAITALIPIFGALIGTIPTAFIILIVNPMQALWFIVLIIVIQQIEGNFIYPMVVGNSIGLSALWVLLAITVGGSTFGILGILIGTPLFAVIYTVLGTITNNRLKNKDIKL